MASPHSLLGDLALVLCVAAIITIVCQKLRLPVVLGYVLSCLVVGPHVPTPLFANREEIETLSELGVILLMFFIGLEFSLRKLVRVGAVAGLITLIEVSLMLSLGYFVGQLFGFSPRECLFTGAIVSISSTMIVAKAFAERPPPRRLVELVFGVLVFEDIVAVLLLAGLTALPSGGHAAASTESATHAMLVAAGKLLLWLLLALLLGLLIIPRLFRLIARLKSDETLLLASVGLAFLAAVLMRWLGYSVALGAFIAGSLVAESGQGEKIERLVMPLRDLFGAVFFVSVGMLIDPRLLFASIPVVLVLVGVVLFGKLLGVFTGAFLTGNGVRTSLAAGLSLTQIGEFSFIIAAVGLQKGETRESRYAVAVAVSVLTALCTPWLVGHSTRAASFVDRRLPRPLQTFAVLYGSWIERLRAPSGEQRSRLRRLIRVMLFDAGCLLLLSIGAKAARGVLAPRLHRLGVPENIERTASGTLIFLLALPFFFGIARASRAIAAVLSRQVVPEPPSGQVDTGAAPRRLLTAALEVLLILLVGLPLVAVTQPFLTILPGAAALLLSLSAVLFSLWRRAKDLQGHVRAVGEVLLEAVVEQSQADASEGEPKKNEAEERPAAPAVPLEVERALPGLGVLAGYRIPAGSLVIGRTLSSLNLRGLTGATVLAIKRDEGGVVAPSAQESLHEKDILILSGSADAVAAAQELLRGQNEAPQS
jgi:CPA2 family monovalent cation:H+ antiporter-2